MRSRLRSTICFPSCQLGRFSMGHLVSPQVFPIPPVWRKGATGRVGPGDCSPGRPQIHMCGLPTSGSSAHDLAARLSRLWTTRALGSLYGRSKSRKSFHVIRPARRRDRQHFQIFLAPSRNSWSLEKLPVTIVAPEHLLQCLGRDQRERPYYRTQNAAYGRFF
jgi:hypothetical protein